ncbi:MAG: pantoate--beta-alanine ligase [Verrucomicrobia bacterium]|nr:pantoate--beta-alanine ligase [Verrucomicrobiota bacterium]NBR63241.1 pantoate--beta-alanine ligase [Verrucomicrobiota bacterium]
MTKPAEMQKASRRWKRGGIRIALVPTMGALHAGHLSLIRRAARLADRVVVSVYVNPTQFDSPADLRGYPRRFRVDAILAKKAGADLLFQPPNLYAEDASTWVEETDRSRGRCGDRRPGHFRGVATVVAKLFNLVQPDVAVFGDKDQQQCEVVERMVRDLFLPVRIVRHPVVREKDGLPLSSRNLRLSGADRQRAGQWAAALGRAAAAGRGKAKTRYRKLVKSIRGVRPEYLELVNGRLFAAAWIAGVRLIDHRPCGRSR